jgi:hypothetical protein
MSQRRFTVAAALVGLLCLATPPVLAEKVTPLMAQDLAGLAGKEGMMLTVEYAPGASSTKHRHNAHVFVYVLEGSVVMQVEGGKAVTLGPGPSTSHRLTSTASRRTQATPSPQSSSWLSSKTRPRHRSFR